MTSNFNERYKKIKQIADSEIEIIENKITEEISLAEPMQSFLKKFLLAPSKRLREVLPVLYFKALGKELSQKQLEVLSVVEIVHNASLIHDDIIDESDLRRGNKTISCEFGNKLGVIAGDYLLSVALSKLCKLSNVEVIQLFSQTIEKMCIGEVNQNFSRFKVGTIEDYIDKTKNKTGYLFETTFLSCAMLDNSSKYNMNSLSEFALNLGIAFQIRDDILNMTTFDKTKPYNSDIEDGIYNAPVILGSKEDNYSSGIEKTKGLLNNYIQKAGNEIKILPENKFRLALEEFLELLGNV